MQAIKIPNLILVSFIVFALQPGSLAAQMHFSKAEVLPDE
jgi:hypothetical protein